MLHTCDQRFDVTENLKNFCELNKTLAWKFWAPEKQTQCKQPNLTTQAKGRLLLPSEEKIGGRHGQNLKWPALLSSMLAMPVKCHGKEYGTKWPMQMNQQTWAIFDAGVGGGVEPVAVSLLLLSVDKPAARMMPAPGRPLHIVSFAVWTHVVGL